MSKVRERLARGLLIDSKCEYLTVYLTIRGNSGELGRINVATVLLVQRGRIVYRVCIVLSWWTTNVCICRFSRKYKSGRASVVGFWKWSKHHPRFLATLPFSSNPFAFVVCAKCKSAFKSLILTFRYIREEFPGCLRHLIL